MPKLEDCKTKEDLASFLNVSVRQIDYFSHAKYTKIYDIFKIPKKNGELRTIYSPRDKLKTIQRKIKESLQEIYCSRINYAMGMEPGTSIVKNARCHVCKKFLVSIDLSNFFETIHIGRVIGLFKKAIGLDDEMAVILSQLVTCNKTLPTGSPCSPVLADMIFYQCDKLIKRYLKLRDITYTRYADDLSFSFNDDNYLTLFFTKPKKGELNPSFENIFAKSGFAINEGKTRLQNKYMHQQVTGVKVNRKTNLRKKYVSEIRTQLYFAEKHGIKDAAARKYPSLDESQLEEKWKRWLAGKISYLGMIKGIEDRVYIKFACRYNKITDSRSFSLKSTDVANIAKEGVSFATCGLDDTSGTCFFYKGKMVTCYHCLEVMECVDEQNKIYHFINNPLDRMDRYAKLVYEDDKSDITIFQPLFFDFIELIKGEYETEVPQNTNVLILGYPSYENRCPNDTEIRNGKVTSHRFYRADRIKMNVTDISVETGFSGGPVLDGNGKLVGMIVYGNSERRFASINNGFISMNLIDEAFSKLDERVDK